MNDSHHMDYLKDNPIDVITSMVLDKPAPVKKTLSWYCLLLTERDDRG
jgi:hypothetical protein